MGSLPSGATLLVPQPPGRASKSGDRTGSLSPEILGQSARRLRVLALLYAFTFFMANFFPNLLSADQRAPFFGDPANWAPGVVSIALALVVSAFTRSPSVSVSVVINVWLAFDVVSSYLETLVQRHGPVPAERAIYLLRQVCHSLAEANAFGLVHRDIKPANLFTCRYGGDHDFVKVLDFGIAKSRAHDVMETGALALTRGNILQGTPAYIAPEQALGGSEVDSRADIYATGCVAYFLLTGQLVFTADTPMRLVVHHAQTRPILPSQRTELPIPPALDQVVMACLAKNPSERSQSARELSRQLGDVGGLRPWTEERAREWWEMHAPSS